MRCAFVQTAALLHSVSALFPDVYPPLSNGSFSGPLVPQSPDVLVAFEWDPSFAGGFLQTFPESPSRVAANPATAASNLSSLLLPFGAASASLDASANFSEVIISFATEHACWLEILVPGGVPAGGSLLGSVSEYNSPEQHPFFPLAQRGTEPGELRLETNAALYDGLRYAFLRYSCTNGTTCAPLPLAGVRRTCQVLPLNYTGAFSSDDDLTRIWYTGAFAVRVNALPGFFGSELLSRGDRAPPFQGDAHVSNKVGLAAFASPRLYALAKAMINLTDSAARSVHDSSIATYPLQWVCTVADYFQATGDVDFLISYSSAVEIILYNATANFFTLYPADLRWSGWDDRLGSGFFDVNETPEARRFYWLTTIRALAAFARAAATVPALASEASRAAAAQANLTAFVRSTNASWWTPFGIHALSAAVMGGWTTPAERAAFAPIFNNSAYICSLSNYDSGFILEAVRVVLGLDYATAMLRLCWGRQLAAGATCWWESTYFYDAMLKNSAERDIDVIPGVQTSGCHAWGSAPTAFMSREILGVAPSAPGFRVFTWSPAVSVRLAHLKGTVPTPKGPVTCSAHVSLDESGDRAIVSLSLVHPPTLSLAVVKLPARLAESTSHPCGALRFSKVIDCANCFVNADNVDDGSVSVSAQVAATEFSGMAVYDRIQCSLLAPTSSSVLGAYKYAPFAPPQYPETLVIDNTTRGYWRDASYGRDGFILFGYSKGPIDFSSLPPYASINCSAPRTLDLSGVGPAPLQDPTDTNKPRRLGAVVNGGKYYEFAVDVLLDATAPPRVNISFYFAINSTLATHIEDFESRNALVPDVTLRAHVPQPPWGGVPSSWNSGGLWDLEKGVYISVVVSKSVRLKAYCVEGCNASVSAIFIDPAVEA